MSNDNSRIMAIDFGSSRIGLSLSDPLKIIAQGLKTIPNNDMTVDEILSVIRAYDVSTIVIGNPINLNGSESAKSVEVASFVQQLKEKTDIPIVLLDERYTSVMAHQTLLQMGTKKRQRRDKGKIDEIASAILLQGYLDSRKR